MSHLSGPLGEEILETKRFVIDDPAKTYLLIKTNTNIKHSPQEFQSAVFQTYRARKRGLLFPHSFPKPPNWWSWLWWWWWWWRWRWWWRWCKVANPANAQRSARLLPESLKLCLGLGPEHFDWRDYHQHHHDHHFPSFVEGWDLCILIIAIYDCHAYHHHNFHLCKLEASPELSRFSPKPEDNDYYDDYLKREIYKLQNNQNLDNPRHVIVVCMQLWCLGPV